MNRRQFVLSAGALGLGSLSFETQSHNAPRFADMHAHLGFRYQIGGFRGQMEKGSMLLVAEKVTSEAKLAVIGGRLQLTREMQPGELRTIFEGSFGRRRRAMANEKLVEVSSLQALDRVLAERTPGIVLAAEGADFLEGDLSYLDKVRAQGLVHLQLVHYYPRSLLGDIATEPATQGGMTAFGLDVVRACNRLGMLVDVAHCSNQGMAQVLEVSTKPIVYSHGHMSPALPSPSQGGSLARAIHAPVARKIAEAGGVVGLWPDWYTYANLSLMADAIARAAEQLGAAHVGIGSDMHGLVRTAMSDYADFASLEGMLGKRGLKPAEVEGIMGGNYIRVLREAMKP